MAVLRKPILRCGPVVCAVDRDYQIMVPVNGETLMSVAVNGKEYFDHAGGVRRSDCPVQRFTVPMDELDAAGEYTLRYCRVLERGAYSCVKGPAVVRRFPFSPVRKKDGINVYVLSDCHGIRQEAVETASYFGQALDLLILNGDVSSSCMTLEEAMLPYDIAWAVTGGRVPVVITLGNHDLRGRYSEQLPGLMPCRDGRFYYPVSLGPLWLLALDCGEDKADAHREYGGTAAYHAMRGEETDFLRRLAAEQEAAGGAARRLVVSHIPVSHRNTEPEKGERPFDIENGLYTEWVELLNEKIRPELYIAGHMHRAEVWQPGYPADGRRLDCPVLIAGKPVHGRDKNVIGAALTLRDGGAEIAFTDKTRRIIATETIRNTL